MKQPQKPQLSETGCNTSELNFSTEYRELQALIRRWRWANRVSAHGAAGVKGLTNLGLLKVEPLMGSFDPELETQDLTST